MNGEAFGALTSILSWIGAILAASIAAVAFVRLRTTGAGLFVACGFGLLALTRLGYRLFRAFVLPDRLEEADVARMMAAGLAADAVAMLALVLLAIGLLTLPAALARPAGPARPATPG